MYKQVLQFDSQAFEQGLTLPAAGSSTAANAIKCASNGRTAIAVIAGDENVLLASGKKLTISYTESDTEGGVYAAPERAASLVLTTSADFSPRKGELLARLPLPPEADGKFIKAVITTDDAAADGLVDVAVEYLAG